MASFFPALLFLFLCISVHVQARESQFFSKFTANADAKTTQVGPTKEQAEFLDKQAQDPPAFVAEDKNGYGLYGHETGQLPSTDVATTKSLADEPYYNKEKNYAGFYDKDVFGNDEENARNTKAMLQGSSYTTAAAEDNNVGNAAENSRNNNYFPAVEQPFRTRLEASNYATGGNRYTANGNRAQKQGMSDTRFLEDGKYYYNVDDEEKYNNPSRYTESRNTEFYSQGYLPNANGNNYEFSNRNNNYNNNNDGNNYEFSNRNNNYNNNNGNYYTDNYAAENAKVMAGGYDPVKNQYVFRATKNDQEFMP